ncbi:hypothetical protein E1508_25085 [Pseudomonas moraviensis]|nr:hypothetical protein E1508_25085 [Pseudomonas moraviensis]
MWKRACSRRRWVIQRVRCLILRFREQARSHRVMRFFAISPDPSPHAAPVPDCLHHPRCDSLAAHG